MYIVFTEHFENGFERWFYGCYATKAEANRVGSSLDIDHGICPAEEAEEWGVKGLH